MYLQYDEYCFLKYFYKFFTDNSLVRSSVEIFYKIDSLIDVALFKN